MTTTDRTTPPAFDLATLDEARARIAELRQQRCHLIASAMRDRIMADFGTWLDPEGTSYTAALQAEQGRQAAWLSQQIDPVCGF